MPLLLVHRFHLSQFCPCHLGTSFATSLSLSIAFICHSSVLVIWAPLLPQVFPCPSLSFVTVLSLSFGHLFCHKSFLVHRFHLSQFCPCHLGTSFATSLSLSIAFICHSSVLVIWAPLLPQVFPCPSLSFVTVLSLSFGHLFCHKSFLVHRFHLSQFCPCHLGTSFATSLSLSIGFSDYIYIYIYIYIYRERER